MHKIIAFQKSLFRCQLRGIFQSGWILLLFLPSMLSFVGILFSLLMFFMYLDSIIRNHESLKLFPVSKRFYVLNIFLSGIIFLTGVFFMYICLIGVIVFVFNLLQSDVEQEVTQMVITQGTSSIDIKRIIAIAMIMLFAYIMGVTMLLKLKKEASCIIGIIILSIISSILVLASYKQPDTFMFPMIILGLATLFAGPLWCMKKEKRLC
jgi:hypothetical protein